MRLKIRESVKEEAMNAAKEAAFEANEKREVGYTTEALIEKAVNAAIDSLETNLA